MKKLTTNHYSLSTIVIGLTGGIASGKSVVVNEFKRLGAKVIDADRIAHQVLQVNQKVKKEVIHSFGKEILKKNKAIDRKKLGKIVFADKKKLSLLNRIIHPPVITEIKKCIIRYQSPNTHYRVVILDAPLLFEAKITNLADIIIVVFASRELQLQRLRERNKLTQKEAEQRIYAQGEIRKKIKFADFVIKNTQDLSFLRKQIKKIWDTLR